MIGLTVFAKAEGALTKHITLMPDGSLKSDGSACIMVAGQARRASISGVTELGSIIEQLKVNEAIALGSLRPDLPDQVEVVVKRKLLNGKSPRVIARTAADLVYLEAQPALALLDYDTKGMPAAVNARLQAHGSYWGALVAVLPDLRTAARVIRRSTSAGIFRCDTGMQLPGSNGLHGYVGVRDGSDIERFLKTLHARCWLAGLGWMMVGAGGQLLERSIVDRMVYGPERLVFEAGPTLDPPLQQDKESRCPSAIAGDLLDTAAACPPLTVAEKAQLQELKAKAAHDLAGERAKARETFIATQAKRIATRKGIAIKDAMATVSRQCEGVLRPDTELAFDDPEFAGCTVADVLADPERFEGETLADPLEGVDYGIGKARIMRRADGSMWIHSFAHGRTVYDLKLDAAAARTMLERADKADVAKLFIDLVTETADLDGTESEQLRDFTIEKSGIGARVINASVKAAKAKRRTAQAQERRQQQLAQRRDPRPSIPVPLEDEEWLPQINTLNEILRAARAPKPPSRNIEGTLAQDRKIVLPKMHAFTKPTIQARGGMPAPEQWVLHAMSDIETAEMIERYINYVDEKGRSVHLPMSFVRHYVQRSDGALPTVVAMATLPIVLADGVLLAPEGLDRQRGIIFEIPKELRDLLPRRADCTEDAVREAMQFLTDDWLVDVAAGYGGKCTVIAAALTIIERTLLSTRPAYFVSAGQRGGGKTTLLIMMILAVTGLWPAAAAWSPNEEERRKALMSYLLAGVPYILWDNIPRGAQISCPHIERSCTSAFYSDRKLGVSETISTAAGAVHLFNGNNVGPRGDLASRSLQIRLTVDRPDPENREFTHQDPIGWTEERRGQILSALYTIMLGNPTLRLPPDAPAKTRFKLWWRIVGSALEHAAGLAGKMVDFQHMFLDQEDDDEDVTSLADALAVLNRRLMTSEISTFKAANVADIINRKGADPSLDEQILQAMTADSAILREFLFPTETAATFVASPKGVAKRLKAHQDAPVMANGQVMVLRRTKDRTNTDRYRVEITK